MPGINEFTVSCLHKDGSGQLPTSDSLPYYVQIGSKGTNRHRHFPVIRIHRYDIIPGFEFVFVIGILAVLVFPAIHSHRNIIVFAHIDIPDCGFHEFQFPVLQSYYPCIYAILCFRHGQKCATITRITRNGISDHEQTGPCQIEYRQQKCCGER